MEFYKLYYRIHNRDDWWRLKNYIAWLAFCKLTFNGGVKMKVELYLSDDEIKKLNELVDANIESDDDAAYAIHLVIELA